MAFLLLYDCLSLITTKTVQSFSMNKTFDLCFYLSGLGVRLWQAAVVLLVPAGGNQDGLEIVRTFSSEQTVLNFSSQQTLVCRNCGSGLVRLCRRRRRRLGRLKVQPEQDAIVDAVRTETKIETFLMLPQFWVKL